MKGETHEQVAQRVYGCSHEEALRLNEGRPLADSSSTAYLYRQQHKNAAARGVEWVFTLREWIDVWTTSGHWQNRGRGRGRYHMGRHGDVGPYSPGNVSVIPAETNCGDSARRRAGQISAKSAERAGHGRGWTYRARLPKPYVSKYRGTHLGCFSTQSEAEAAYGAAHAGHAAMVAQVHGGFHSHFK